MSGVARLHVAVALGEWDTALTHLLSMRRSGVPVPTRIIQQVRAERLALEERWSRLGGRREHAVEEARAYCTAHLTEVEELLREER